MAAIDLVLHSCLSSSSAYNIVRYIRTITAFLLMVLIIELPLPALAYNAFSAGRACRVEEMLRMFILARLVLLFTNVQ